MNQINKVAQHQLGAQLVGGSAFFPGTFWPVGDVGFWPIATEIHVSLNVGDQGKSGLVVLNVSFVARDPKETRSEPLLDHLVSALL